MTAFLSAPWLHHALMGALAGALSAAHIDYAAFSTWQSFDDARKYNWNVACWRWLKGAVIGGVTTVASGSVLG